MLYVVDDHHEKIELPHFSVPTIVIRNKIDLQAEAPSSKKTENYLMIALSAQQGTGLHLLKEAIKTLAGFTEEREGSFSARSRHLDALGKAGQALDRAYQHLHTTKAAELIAEELRLVQLHLNSITGEFTNEDLLGRIFSSFCIGK